jgi:hypothetical protein
VQPTIGLPPPHPQNSYGNACSIIGLNHSDLYSRDIRGERASFRFQLVMDDEDCELCLRALAFVFRQELYFFLDVLPKFR